MLDIIIYCGLFVNLCTSFVQDTQSFFWSLLLCMFYSSCALFGLSALMHVTIRSISFKLYVFDGWFFGECNILLPHLELRKYVKVLP